MDGLTPCAEANAFFDAMIIAMWKDRAERLEEKHGMLKRKRALRRKRPRPLDPGQKAPVRKKRRRERGAEGPRASPIQSIRRFFNQNPQRELPTPPLCGGPQPRAHTYHPHNQHTIASQSHVHVRPRSPPDPSLHSPGHLSYPETDLSLSSMLGSPLQQAVEAHVSDLLR